MDDLRDLTIEEGVPAGEHRAEIFIFMDVRLLRVPLPAVSVVTSPFRERRTCPGLDMDLDIWIRDRVAALRIHVQTLENDSLSWSALEFLCVSGAGADHDCILATWTGARGGDPSSVLVGGELAGQDPCMNAGFRGFPLTGKEASVLHAQFRCIVVITGNSLRRMREGTGGGRRSGMAEEKAGEEEDDASEEE